ncbi:MAG TPA: hypothetical protein GXX38_05550 [Clostridia bacterium]|jgi:hypothetical protein|nr:hypothetical protein [Clostridia bacterium]
MSEKRIMAVVTTNKDIIWGGGCPIIEATSFEEMERIALYLSRILDGAVHDLENGIYIIVKH